MQLCKLDDQQPGFTQAEKDLVTAQKRKCRNRSVTALSIS